MDQQLRVVDALSPDDWGRFFQEASIDAILAEHVWEHLTEEEGVRAAGVCFEYLRPEGYLRVAVPDGLHPDPKYIEHVKPGGTGPGADDHKILYTCHRFREVFENVGFRTRLLEYFDDRGVFHFEDWNPRSGFISRSRRFDPRNRVGELKYTSIILDCLKPEHDSVP